MSGRNIGNHGELLMDQFLT